MRDTTATPAGTYADREALALQIANLQSEMQAYTRASGGKGDPQVLIWYANQIHDAMKAMETLPAEPVREDILLQALGGSYYTGETSFAGVGAQSALGAVGLDLPADIRDISYDIQNWRSVPGWQKAVDFAAVLPVVGAIKPVTNAIEAGADAAKTADRAMSAMEAAGDAVKHGDELVDAGRAAAHLAESGTAAAEGAKLADRLMEAGQTANKTLADAGNVGYSSPVIVTVSPETVRFSQKTVNGSRQLIEDMKLNGWHGEPIDVVRMPDGELTSIDNTRLRAANITNTEVVIRIHEYDEAFPRNLLVRFESKHFIPSTWGDAIRFRIGDQGATFIRDNPYGTLNLPRENS